MRLLVNVFTLESMLFKLQQTVSIVSGSLHIKIASSFQRKLQKTNFSVYGTEIMKKKEETYIFSFAQKQITKYNFNLQEIFRFCAFEFSKLQLLFFSISFLTKIP